MHIKQYLKNLSFLFILNFTIKPIWVFVLERKFQLVLGVEQYGLYFSFLSLVYILSVLLDLGLHSFAVKTISAKYQNNDFSISGIVKSKMWLILLYIIVVIAVVLIKKFNFTDTVFFLSIALMQLLFSIYQFLRTIMQGIQKHRWDSFLSSLDRVFLIIIGFGLLYTISSTITLMRFVTVYLIAYSLSIIAIVYLLSREKINLNHLDTSQSKIVQIVKEGYPLILIQLLMTIYTRVDAVMLNELRIDGNEQSSILAFSFRFIDAAYNALFLLSVFLLPSVSHHFAKNEFQYIRKIVFISFGLATLMAFGFILPCYFGAEFIYGKMYHIVDIQTIKVFKIQLWTVLGVGWMYVFGSYLTAIGAYFWLLSIVFVGMVMSVGFNYILIPEMGALGAAYSSLIVQLTIGLFHLLVGIYFLKFNKIEK